MVQLLFRARKYKIRIQMKMLVTPVLALILLGAVSIMFRVGPIFAIARNKVWFEVTRAYSFNTDGDIVTNLPQRRSDGWLFQIVNSEDDTGQAVTNPSIKVQTERKFVDYFPEPVVSDGNYSWNFRLELPESFMLPVGGHELGCIDYHSPGFSAERHVSPEVIVDHVTIQNLSIVFTLEEPLPADVNSINIMLRYPRVIYQEQRLVNYTVLSLNNVGGWTAGIDHWYANPSDLVVGKTYKFQAILEVMKSPKESVLTAKPWIQIHYSHWEPLRAVVGSSATVTHPDGPKVTMSAEGDYEWYPSLCYSRQDFIFEMVTTPIPPPMVDFSHYPEISWVNESIAFNASAKSASNNITSYEWDFGDGNITTVTVPTINHAYTREGKYPVTLNVTDSYGLWTVTSQHVAATFRCDLNRDCAVNILDVSIVARAYGTKPGDENWNPIADLDGNKEINIIDISKVAKDYGKTV